MNPTPPAPAWQATGTLLEVIAARRDALRPSDAKVADVVLAAPASIIDLSIAGLAAAAGVSEPTVIRFCTSVGFDGYRSFKIALTRAVALGLPVENSGIQAGDSPAVVVDKVFQRTISSLDRARRALDVDAIDRAIALILDAGSLLFLGMGASGLVAQDAQAKFPLFGVPCQAPQDAHLQFAAASLATPGTVAIAISESGHTVETVRAARAVHEAGGRVIVLTGNEGPMSQFADVELRSVTFEDTDLFTPTVSRLAALVVIDILSSGVAVRRPPALIERVGAMRENLSDVRIGTSRRKRAGTPRA